MIGRDYRLPSGRSLETANVTGLLLLMVALPLVAADLPGANDAPGMKRYEGSEIIGYRAPKFDEFVLPLGPPTQIAPPTYAKSQKVAGLVSRYTYVAPAGRSPAELFRNYQLEFQRLGLVPLYQKAAGERGWFGPTLAEVSDEDHLGQILAYNEDQERVLIAKSPDATPSYFYLFATAYKDGVIPEPLRAVVQKDRALAELIIIAPENLQKRMTFVSAQEMASSLASSGRVALYGIYFDTDKDTIRPDSLPALQEVARLLAANPQLKLHVVGHTDNQGEAAYNLDLSRRRAAGVVSELISKYRIVSGRLDSFGAGLYAPVASNQTEEGRARNRRVELVAW